MKDVPLCGTYMCPTQGNTAKEGGSNHLAIPVVLATQGTAQEDRLRLGRAMQLGPWGVEEGERERTVLSVQGERRLIQHK